MDWSLNCTHTRILRAAEGMGENQFRVLAPGFARITRPDGNQITVRVSVRITLLAKRTPLWCAPKSHEQSAIIQADNRWKCAVKLLVLIDDNIVLLLNAMAARIRLREG